MNMQKPLPQDVEVLGDASEDAFARAFTAKFRHSLRFDHDRGHWFEWNGTYWHENRTQVAFYYARQFAKALGGDDEAKFCRASVAAGVERFARADPVHAVTSEMWDADPWLLGTPGGVVDLRSGAMRRAMPDDFITKVTGVAPVTGEPVRWLQFLREATAGDEGLMRFLRQVFGYCLTGETREHALFFIHGPGGNGKSVFLNILLYVLGDYAATASMDTFTASKSDRHPTDMAMLKDTRIVSASETEEGRAWAESRIKQLTGGDPVSARFMRQDFFTFTPQFKLVIVGNHAPVLAHVDEAARRRFNIIPFTHRPVTPDRELETKLRAEAGQILTWAIEGCKDWQDNGLFRPDIVASATNMYFDSQDLIGQWIESRCKLSGGGWEHPLPLFRSWQDFCKENGEESGTQKSFGSSLQRRGIQRCAPKVAGNIPYRGISLRGSRDNPSSQSH